MVPVAGEGGFTTVSRRIKFGRRCGRRGGGMGGCVWRFYTFRPVESAFSG